LAKGHWDHTLAQLALGKQAEHKVQVEGLLLHPEGNKIPSVIAEWFQHKKEEHQQAYLNYQHVVLPHAVQTSSVVGRVHLLMDESHPTYHELLQLVLVHHQNRSWV
jgi:hypothetical protein